MNNNWIEENNQLQKTYTFQSFVEAMLWMIKASYIIERMDHHPEWTNTYNKVQVKLCTHSAGNVITNEDRQLAEALDALNQS
jgi:4a-hydroxytetrahydrobiopterin dehydratase